MKNLTIGKLLLLIIFPLLLNAKVTALLDKPLIYKGESAILSLKAEGEDIEFPKIDKIGGFRVLGTSQSSNYSNINGKVTKSLSKSYTFNPTSSVDIPSFSIKVDGKIQKTKPLKLKVVSPANAPKDKTIQLILKADKKEAYVGEDIKLDLIFRHLPQVRYDKIEINPPKLDGFWSKQIPGSKSYACGDYICESYSFILTPQQAGEFKIPATFARLGKRESRAMGGSLFNDPFFDDPFFNGLMGRLSWKKIFSNDLTIDVKKLPGDVDIYGDFTIDATVDKTEVKSGKPVNLTIKIKGSGNIDDIEKFDLDIDGAIVYADEPEISSHIEGSKTVGEFIQKIAIVADNNFTIPAIRLKYFDKDENSTKTIKTDPIEIKVEGSSKNITTPHIQKSYETKEAKNRSNITKNESKAESVSLETDSKLNYLYLILAFLAGVVATISSIALKNRFKKEKKRRVRTISDEIAKAKGDRELFNLLLPFANESNKIREELKKLEENLYKGAKNKIDREKILDHFEEEEEG